MLKPYVVGSPLPQSSSQIPQARHAPQQQQQVRPTVTVVPLQTQVPTPPQQSQVKMQANRQPTPPSPQQVMEARLVAMPNGTFSLMDPSAASAQSPITYTVVGGNFNLKPETLEVGRREPAAVRPAYTLVQASSSPQSTLAATASPTSATIRPSSVASGARVTPQFVTGSQQSFFFVDQNGNILGAIQQPSVGANVFATLPLSR